MFKIESPKIKNTIVSEFDIDKESYENNIFSDIIFEELNYKVDFNSCVFENVDFNNKKLDGFERHQTCSHISITSDTTKAKSK